MADQELENTSSPEAAPQSREPATPASEVKPGAEGKKLAVRIIVGLLLAAFTITMVVWDTLAISLWVLVLAMLGVGEFYRMAERKNIRPSRANGYAAVFILLTTAYLGKEGKEEYLLLLLAGLIMISMLGYLFRRGFHVSSFLDVGVTVLGFLYVGWFFSYIIFLRKMEGAPFNLYGFSIERGAGYVLLLLFATHFTDTGAFFVGKFFGKHKLAPHISPQKTVEGAIGGMAGAIAGAFLVGKLLKMHDIDLLTIGILCGIFSQLGDLWASVLKRDVNVKDAGALFAGHGGVLDRADSVLYTAPIIYFYLKFFY